MDMMVIGAGIALVVLALCVWLYMRFMRSQDDGRDDRFSPERILSAEQVAMLDYLQDTFPGQVVLPNVTLAHMLSVRRANNKDAARNRLKEHKVDFVVCAPDGRPTFAFDIEQYHLSNAEAKAQRVKIKNRILKTAGVRFVFLKNGIHRMPSPSEFRAQLNLVELPKPRAAAPAPQPERETAVRELESQMSTLDEKYGNSSYRDSEVLGLSGLMDLEDELSPRRSRANAEPRKYDGGSYDVRGGR
jgi:Protein of unknown function (DUF2726)